jgi:Holliday junction DNA helicase RuvA
MPGTVTFVIGYLRGTSMGGDILDVNGVGYLVHTPTALPEGEEAELHVTTVVRDDAIVLYGFSSSLEKDVFGALTKVTGVGPASALSLLGSLGVAGIAAAVAGRDDTALSGVRGIGKKTAASIIMLATLPDAAHAACDPRSDELASALTGLGYDKPTARSLAADAIAAHPGADDTELISAALALAGALR